MRTLTMIANHPVGRMRSGASLERGRHGRARSMFRRAIAAPPWSGERPPRADPLLTAEEVAALLRVTKSWVYAETRGQRIPHVRLGRYVRYRRSAVLKWIAELEHGSDRHARHVG